MPLNDSGIEATVIANHFPVASQDDDHDDILGLAVTGSDRSVQPLFCQSYGDADWLPTVPGVLYAISGGGQSTVARRLAMAPMSAAHKIVRAGTLAKRLSLSITDKLTQLFRRLTSDLRKCSDKRMLRAVTFRPIRD